jgi:hypothetical protein
MTALPISAELRARLERALTRRFGQSVMPIRINPTRKCWQVIDVETGSWIEAVESGARIRVIAERDGAAL